MKYVPLDEAAAGLEGLVLRATRFNEPVGIAGPEGNAVLLSEEEYDAITETLFILHSRDARDQILEAAAEDVEDAIREDDADW